MRTIPYGFADACGIASSENHLSKFPRKLAWEVEERARGKHANPKELCENPNIYYRTIKKRLCVCTNVRLYFIRGVETLFQASDRCEMRR